MYLIALRLPNWLIDDVVFVSDEGGRLMEETEENLTQLLYDPSYHVSPQNEEKVWSFLEMRLVSIFT